jgi:DNA-binding FadR family transcriptional regulator
MDGEGRAPRDWTLADQVYEQVLTRIVEGHYPEGARLPSETVLSEGLGVSRPVLRQALKQLRHDGIIVSRQGSGSYVQRRPDRAILTFAPVGSIADIRRTFEFRLIVEAEAARLAAQRWTDQDMAAMGTAFAALDRAVEAGTLGAEEDEAFHLAVCRASDNHYFPSVIASMHGQILAAMRLARSLTLTRPATRLRLVQAEHRAVLDAIRSRDGDGAHAAMAAHVGNARDRVFEGGPEAR